MLCPIGELIAVCEKKYMINGKAGMMGLTKTVSWVYVAEDIDNVNFINSGELIITTGYFTRNGISLLEFVSAMIQKSMSGLIINTGKYIMEEDITEKLLDLCDRNHFPLFTLPWQIHLTDVLQELCKIILTTSKKEEDLTGAFMEALDGKPETATLLLNGFADEDSYRIYCTDRAEDKSKLHNLLSHLGKAGHIMDHKGYTLLITVQKEDAAAVHFPERVGVSSVKTGYHSLQSLCQQAITALRAGEILRTQVTCYDNIGLLALILAVEDREVLSDFSRQRIGILEEYDAKHQASLVETLFYYVRANGSLAKAAQAMHTHKNTIGYRVAKIKELLDWEGNLLDHSEEFIAAVYIKRMFAAEKGNEKR